jgi:BirA family transcriptional regulator, biotin operon repressor / biotin---[acetyl-CoA-carboxylase] ligase
MALTAPTPLTFRALRLLSDGEFQSGEALARALRVSRTTVWKALQAAEGWGVTLFKVHGRGYRLVTPVDWLDGARVREQLGACASMFQVELVEVADSTNTVLLNEALAGAPAGLVVAAELQTQGRGRRGRAWHTGLGGALTFSVLWRFEQGVRDLGGLSLAVGIALVRALKALGVEGAMVKWPNDVVWQHQKLGGVLTEIEGDVMGPSAAVIGIGLNVYLDPDIRQRIDQAVTDVASTGVRVDRSRLLAACLVHLADVLRGFARDGFAPLRAEWEASNAFAGHTMALTLADRSEQIGVAAGVADDGALLLQTETGLRRFYSGDVSVRAARHSLRSA